MRRTRGLTMVLSVGALAAVGLAALWLLPRSGAAQVVAERTWYITVHEPRGGTTALAPPPVDPSTLSKGYVYHPVGFDPARPTRWEVESYIYAPASLLAVQGERVTLKIFVVNGDEHVTSVLSPEGRPVPVTYWISGPGGARLEAAVGVTTFNTPRGRESNVSFRATSAGTYTILCGSHGPSMQAQLVVLPRR
jgi:plastocyanin